MVRISISIMSFDIMSLEKQLLLRATPSIVIVLLLHQLHLQQCMVIESSLTKDTLFANVDGLL